MPKVTIKKVPQANSGLQVEDNNIKPISPSIQMITGDSHKNGGEMVSYGGQTVEAQGNEPISPDNNGNMILFGKLKVPETKITFETAAKRLANQENKNVKQADRAVRLINTSDPYDKFEALSFNTGLVLGNAAKINQTEMLQVKQNLGDMQQEILDRADALGVKPEKLQKMKNGGTMKVKIKGLPQAKEGKKLTPEEQAIEDFITNSPFIAGNTGFIPYDQRQVVAPRPQGTLAQRNNNPGNLRFNGQKGATKGDGGFAKFDSYEAGYQALINDITAKQTGKSKTGLKPTSTILDLMKVYSPAADSNNPQALAQTLAKGLGVGVDAPIGNLDTNQLAKLISINEDAAYARQQGVTPTQIQNGFVTPIAPPQAPNVQPIYPQGNPQQDARGEGFTPDTTSYIPNYNDNQLTPIQASLLQDQIAARPTTNPQVTNGNEQPQLAKNNFNYLSLLPEVAAILDRPDYVQGQQFTPTLYEPYRVSMQDQINQNQANFNQVAQLANNNPSALGILAGQLYQQNQGVLANEFRTNQQIANQVGNQNTELLNQAQQANIQLNDQQYVRQEQAKAITEQNRMNALNSISDKVQQHQAFNNNQALLNNLFNYRRDINGNMVYIGGGADLNLGTPQAQPNLANMTPEQIKVEQAKLKLQEQQLRFQQQQRNNQVTQYITGRK